MTLDLGISSEADQSGADGPPLPFGQGDGGEGFGVPGAGGHRVCFVWFLRILQATPHRIRQGVDSWWIVTR